jgi:hypothetical protein
MTTGEMIAVAWQKATMNGTADVKHLAGQIDRAIPNAGSKLMDEMTTGEMIALAWKDATMNETAAVEELAGQIDRAIK